MDSRGQVGLFAAYPSISLKAEQAQIIDGIVSTGRLSAQTEMSYIVALAIELEPEKSQ